MLKTVFQFVKLNNKILLFLLLELLLVVATIIFPGEIEGQFPYYTLLIAFFIFAEKALLGVILALLSITALALILGKSTIYNASFEILIYLASWRLLLEILNDRNNTKQKSRETKE